MILFAYPISWTLCGTFQLIISWHESSSLSISSWHLQHITTSSTIAIQRQPKALSEAARHRCITAQQVLASQ
jgi:hypothetical protein